MRRLKARKNIKTFRRALRDGLIRPVRMPDGSWGAELTDKGRARLAEERAKS